MGKPEKKMCKQAKDGVSVGDNELLREIRNADFVCKKCLRVASSKNLLCKPMKIGTPE